MRAKKRCGRLWGEHPIDRASQLHDDSLGRQVLSWDKGFHKTLATRLVDMKQNCPTPDNSTLIEQAEARTDQANTRTDEANTRTEQAKTREQGMRASELTYRRLFETAKDGILILDAETGMIVDVNPFLVELLGYSHAVFLGKKVWELGFFKDVIANEANFVELQQQEYIRYENMALETSDGRRIEVEFVSNVYLADGHKVIQCNIRDITERKAAEMEMSRLGAIVESSDDAIFGTDMASIITSWNKGAEKIFGYTSGDIVGTSIMRLIPANWQEEENQILGKIKRGEYAGQLETLRQTKDGRLVDVSITASPIKDSTGKVIGMSKILRDIRVRKEQEREIARLSRLYAALSQINQAIVTLNNREELFAKICRVLVEVGKLRMAWVGWLDAKTRRVIPVAQCGDCINYLSQVTIYADDRPEGQGPTGTAIREERNYICNDFSHDPRTLMWRKAAEQAGLQSSASLVIRQGGVICGAITVYSAEMDFFKDREIALLEEATVDISFALDNFVREAARRQAENQLIWKTALLEAQVDSSIDGILVVDDQGKKILQNQRLNELWKIPLEVAGNTDDSVQARFVSDRTKSPRQFAAEIAHLNSHQDEVSRDEVELIDGTFLDRYSSPVRDKAGEYYGRIWTFRDISEHKRMETALRQSTRFLRSTLDAISAHIAILDEHGTIIEVNAAWKHFASENHFMGSGFGVGNNYLQVCDAATGKFSQEAPAVASGIRAIIAGQCVMFTLEYPCHSPKEKRWFILRVTRFGGDGPVRAVVTHENISERKRIEMRFRRLVDSNAQGVIFWNTKGEITESNDAFLNLIGYTRADLEAGIINWMRLTPPEFAQLDRQCLEEIAAVGVCKPYEKEYIHKDGRRVPIVIGAAAFEDAPNEGLCFVLDLTERKKVEAQFLRVQRMESIGTLAAGIAHDLNNVLAPILMAVEILGEKITDDAGREILASLEASAQHGAELVKQVLAFARGMEGRRLMVNPIHILHDIQKIIRDTFPKNIHFSFAPSRDLWTVTGDPTQLHQVFTNLCVNARDAMPDGGTLSVTMENAVLDDVYAGMNPDSKTGAYVMVKVMDTGTGIPPKILERIFEPFFTTKEIGKGTGMGLSTTVAIVKSHGGFITVYSEMGKGTTFKVYLPANTTSKAAETPHIKQAPIPHGNGELVLVVDDEKHIRAIAQKTLERFGYRVLLAANGAEAVALYAQNREEIAIVLTDMAMPVMDGASTLVALRAMNPQVKAVASSGLTVNGENTQAFGAGFKHFIPKPYTAEAMLNILAEALREQP